MPVSTSSVTAGEIMDRSAILLNDPAKTDYTYAVLGPFLRMALDELTLSLVDSQSSPTIQTSTSYPILQMILETTQSALYPEDSVNDPKYPADLVEIQEIGERVAGDIHAPFIPMTRVEFLPRFPRSDRLMYWAWENQVIYFNPFGANTRIELQLRYIRDFNYSISEIDPAAFVGSMNSRSFLAYKTASYASQFIGENTERAQILDAKAERALEMIDSINNKGRQQIMTRHRPFRAAYKMRGGF